MLSDFVKTADWKSEKHVPVIDCPDVFVSGMTTDISVCVGKEIPHPDTPAHFIAWIALHFVPESSSTSIELFRCELSAHGASADGNGSGPVHSANKIVCSVRLTKPGKLYATAFCNIHGLWSSEKSVSIE